MPRKLVSVLRSVNVLGPATAPRVSLRVLESRLVLPRLLRVGAVAVGEREAVRLMLSAREMPVSERLGAGVERVSRVGSMVGTPEAVRGTTGAER